MNGTYQFKQATPPLGALETMWLSHSNTAVDMHGQMDEFVFYGDNCSTDVIDKIYGNYTESHQYPFYASLPPPGPPGAALILVNITWPSPGAGFNAYNSSGNLWVNGTFNTSSVTTCGINDTDWTSAGANLDMGFNFTFYNNTNLIDDEYHLLVYCNSTAVGETGNGTDTIYFTYDKTSPLFEVSKILEENKTVVYNYTLTGQVNISDPANGQLYSVYVNMSNGTEIYSITNIGQADFQLNLSFGVDTKITDYIDIEACDAHTSNYIRPVDKISYEDNGLNFVVRDGFLWDDDWVRIYPKDSGDFLRPPPPTKLLDRYPFTFLSKNPIYIETFVVESNKKITVARKQDYIGHLVIPELGNGYWIDFMNKKVTDVNIIQIDDYKVEVTLTFSNPMNRFDFESIGELNCISRRYYYANINPTPQYVNYVLVGSTQPINITYTINTSMITSINTTLVYNNTYYYNSPTTNNISTTVTVPSYITGASENLSMYWWINVSGQLFNTSSFEQNVSDFYLDNCTLYSTKSLNFSIYDELNGSPVSSDLSGTFYYTYNSVTKSFELDVQDKTYVEMCISPNYFTFTGNYSLQYSADGYPQRSTSDNYITYSNITQDFSLYLLAASYGIYVRFRVIDQYGNAVSGVEVTMEDAGGSTIEVENTDGSGLATFWVDPDTNYLFTFIKAGYTTYSTTLRPTSSEIYTVTMTTESSGSLPSYSVDVDYSFSPVGNLNNDTAYDFIFNLTSDYYPISSCNFSLFNSSDMLSTIGGTYADGYCNALINYNTGNQTIIIAQATYELNNSQNITVSRQYTVYYYYTGQFSLKNFIDDLKNFSGAGFNNFTRMVIALIIILAIMLPAANKLGTGNPIPLLIMLSVLVWLLSYIGFMRIDLISIPTDWLKNYILAILITLGSGAIVVNEVSR